MTRMLGSAREQSKIMAQMLRSLTIGVLSFVVVLSTSSSVANADGIPPSNPLHAPLRVQGSEENGAWLERAGRPVFGYGLSPQYLLQRLPVGEAIDPDYDFRDYAEWAKIHGTTIVRSYPPTTIVGPRYVDLFERAEADPARFDLTRFNPAYFERLREACELLRDADVIVHFQIWQAIAWKKHWAVNYYHPDHNVNPDIAEFAEPGEFVVSPTSAPALVSHQREHVRRMLDATGDLGNVIYDVMNEIGNGTGVNGEWVEAMLDEVESWERQTGHDVLVGLNDEGRDRASTGFARTNPRFELAFLDRGDPQEIVEARTRLGKPVLGVRNLDWNPIEKKREYFAIEKDVSITGDESYASRSLRSYWRVFLAGSQLNAGYADYGSVAYWTLSSWKPFLPPAGIEIDAPSWQSRVPVDAFGSAPGELASGIVFSEANSSVGAIFLIESLPGTSGRHWPEGVVSWAHRDFPGTSEAHSDLPVTVLNLGGRMVHETSATLRGDEWTIPTPSFLDGAVVLVWRDSAARPVAVPQAELVATTIQIRRGGSEALPIDVAPVIQVIRDRPNEVVLWAKLPPASDVARLEWEKRAPAGEWQRAGATVARSWKDSDAKAGNLVEYRVRALDSMGRSSGFSAEVEIHPKVPSIVNRLRVVWWKFSEEIKLAAIVGAIAFGAASGVLIWRTRTVGQRTTSRGR